MSRIMYRTPSGDWLNVANADYFYVRDNEVFIRDGTITGSSIACKNREEAQRVADEIGNLINSGEGMFVGGK